MLPSRLIIVVSWSSLSMPFWRRILIDRLASTPVATSALPHGDPCHLTPSDKSNHFKTLWTDSPRTTFTACSLLSFFSFLLLWLFVLLKHLRGTDLLVSSSARPHFSPCATSTLYFLAELRKPRVLCLDFCSFICFYHFHIYLIDLFEFILLV
ncbi:hypothetical protein BDQ94DRAFT_152457 [Aspergillus welwitschiae]|jgi:hypothetical protein|uniref:Uncharacterized protein n=2 Tax=Aspergillus TaxID=5052 RepID=A0A3F3PMZ4_9EURO|nr:uncharacterized protein BO96DRAFT_236174 [Aspergillus niger CBS 101883]XP_026621301.1 hypothetical protein BDQ94DRAFT_152457 [Aspergillus welwitschiae]PYH50358.1 hypothetical protein BO96DRAFT_236174 [Aspergillus niger CBS 101883]RDH28279.1 hypothetical protein BDQ94DRAFT_152457 [Aspergillus welwitschiae]RDK46281.1 hypothetical protein M752DRAFT_100169 [Aspergillus phoenicis ATCC 13157]